MKRRTVRPLLLMLVSKDKELQRQVQRCLPALGSASNGLVIVRNEPEWHAVLQRERPRLIILDDSISPGNGPHLLGTLRHQLAEVLTIYLAERHSLELERTVRQLGVLYYTEKPPDWDALGQVLASVFSVPAPPPRCTASPATDEKARRGQRKMAI